MRLSFQEASLNMRVAAFENVCSDVLKMVIARLVVWLMSANYHVHNGETSKLPPVTRTHPTPNTAAEEELARQHCCNDL